MNLAKLKIISKTESHITLSYEGDIITVRKTSAGRNIYSGRKSTIALLHKEADRILNTQK